MLAAASSGNRPNRRVLAVAPGRSAAEPQVTTTCKRLRPRHTHHARDNEAAVTGEQPAHNGYDGEPSASSRMAISAHGSSRSLAG